MPAQSLPDRTAQKAGPCALPAAEHDGSDACTHKCQNFFCLPQRMSPVWFELREVVNKETTWPVG